MGASQVDLVEVMCDYASLLSLPTSTQPFLLQAIQVLAITTCYHLSIVRQHFNILLFPISGLMKRPFPPPGSRSSFAILVRGNTVRRLP